jgi:multidrug efflux pump subunit AcrB
MPFSTIMTGIGCISLAGVVVNNAIVLIDFINQERKRGLDIEAAIASACAIRFRPVMLTAITTILGLIPMAMGVSYDFRSGTWIVGGESSQWWGPMAIAVIFGLAFATLLTLIVVPTLYSLLDSLSRTVRRADAG